MMLRPLLTLMLLFAAELATSRVPLTAQAPAPRGDPRVLLARAEQMQDVDDPGALRLVNQALAAIPAGDSLRLRALVLQCWTSAG
jgi:hypothetical protein